MASLWPGMGLSRVCTAGTGAGEVRCGYKASAREDRCRNLHEHCLGLRLAGSISSGRLTSAERQTSTGVLRIRCIGLRLCICGYVCVVVPTCRAGWSWWEGVLPTQGPPHRVVGPTQTICHNLELHYNPVRFTAWGPYPLTRARMSFMATLFCVVPGCHSVGRIDWGEAGWW
jgi:hypothetical protein